MSKPITIERFIEAIQKLPSDPPIYHPQRWSTTQKEHWLGWLKEYHGPGAYNRQIAQKRDAKYAYNHIVAYEMLLWLIEAAGIDSQEVDAAKRAIIEPATMQGKSAAIRRVVPWKSIERALWGTQPE